MTRVLFICHGNICRSPMAEFVFRSMVDQAGQSDNFYIASAATSTEEIGNPVHPGTKNKLKQAGISVSGKYAVQMKKSDYKNYDYLIGMDSWNIKNIMRIIGSDPQGKVTRLLDFTDHPGDIADPWYTGNFDKTYEDICKGCQALLKKLL